VLCVNGLWTTNNDCLSGQLCDARLGSTAGSCQNVVTECAGKSPGDAVCNGQVTEICGPDLVSVSTVKTCTNQACVNGSCQGSCTPLQKHCDPAGSNGTQTCDSNGSWGPLTGCTGTTPVCSAGDCVACPSTGGPVMVGVPLNYCIDSTEVTQGQYQAWLNTNPQPSNQISVCSMNQDFTPGGTWPPASSALSLPVTSVQWCDAYAYCKAVGKRLCGKIGGESNGYSDYANAAQSQWYAACSSNGTYAYPYGNSHQSKYCNDADAALDTTAVATMPRCQSTVTGYAGVYDLSGNVCEWEDSCNGTSGASDMCRVRGGSAFNDSASLRCDADSSSARGSAGVIGRDVGIRCCWP
jgi:formylglycine-generating enzyme